MQKALKKLSQELGDFEAQKTDIHPRFEEFLGNCTVALMAGGDGSRLKNVTGKLGVNKNALELPNGETMIERTIKMYRDVGIKRFVALVYHKASSVEDLLGDGTQLGVEITYSHDPDRPVGKGGAVKNAFVNGALPKDSYFIVHNPDDQILGDTETILKNMFNQFLYFEDQGAVSCLVAVEGNRYPYSGMQIQQSKVVDSEYYPFVPIPTHVGVTLFTSEAYAYFDERIHLDEKVDFEVVLFPVWQNENKLYACNIPVESWIAVNDEKGLKKLIRALDDEE